MEKIRLFAGILQAPETSSKLSHRLCTAEGVGSNPIGSTPKCVDLQVKREGWVKATELIRGLVLQPILQRVFRGAICAVQQGALLGREQAKITAERIAEALAVLCSGQP